MLDFIKRNKIFSGCFIFCIIIILLLIVLILVKDLSADEDVIVIPPIKNEEEVIKDPEITLFTGAFSDETDTLHLTWDYDMYNHTFQKVELYKIDKEDILVKTLYSERSHDVSIYDYGISTGDNEFELRIYYDNGVVVSKSIDVFVDYAFNFQFEYQLIDNNIGKGYLVVFKYYYNKSTPAGLPNLSVSTNTTLPYWKWEKYGEAEFNEIGNGYQEATIYYLIDLNEFSDKTVLWEFVFKLDSVGVRVEKEFEDNALTSIPITNDMELK